MTGVLAYLACVTATAALLCGHQGEAFPPFTWRRARKTPRWGASAIRARFIARRARRSCEEAGHG